jgi:hypothetical protein
MFELDLEDTLSNLGFTVLSADSPEDIDKWPSLDNLFPVEKKYSLYLIHPYEKTETLVSSEYSEENAIKTILLFQSNQYNRNFIKYMFDQVKLCYWESEYNEFCFKREV